MSQVFSPNLVDHGSVGTGTSTPELGKGLYHRITCTGATRTIANPILGTRESPTEQPDNSLIVPIAGKLNVGTVLFIEVRATGGALTLTWGSLFKGAATAIGSAQRRIFPFVWTGTEFVLANGASDVPN